LRRLAWLLLFGAAHFFLFWWGDILFSFALVGIIALFMRELSIKVLTASALLIFAGWHIGGAVMSIHEVHAEEQVRLGTASPGEVVRQAQFRNQIAGNAVRELAEYRTGFIDQIVTKLEKRPLWLVKMTWPNVGETLPLMLIGMALYRSGFFSSGWPRRRLWQLAITGTLSGLALTLAAFAWLWPRGFPPQGMTAALLYWLAIPHLLMAAGYAALLVLATPRLLATRIGKRLAATGRMAFSNYIGTTILMTAIFYGWGLGLIGTVDRVEELGFVALAWALMLAWSAPWLALFRQGPLEWLWRSLTEARFLPFRR
jgi:uncharacterized protein